MRIKKLAVVFFTGLWMVGHIHAQVRFFVSPEGNDKNPGTKEKPFATIQRAQLKARSVTDSAYIYLREGRYYLSQPLLFSAADSREKAHPLVIEAYEGENVLLSGGKKLRLNWEKYNKGIYRAKVRPGIDFDQLFVDGVRYVMARYPNFDSSARVFGGTSAESTGADRVTGWQSPEGGFLHALHKHEWGDMHYRITGKSESGELMLEGGWQNNRQMGIHDRHRFVENIFEELDTVNEWFFDKKAGYLYFFPPQGLNLNKACVEVANLKSIIEIRGSESDPVSNIHFRRLRFMHTLRTFMETREPLLRSDWTIYRGGAVVFEGAVNCSVEDCEFTYLGGNALFFTNYNRYCVVSGSLIHDIGASPVCFVGDPSAVRSPSFEYNEFIPLDQLDKIPGPRSANYPAFCTVYNNLMFNSGQIEKQSAGVQLSMCQDITISHNTIHDLPRAGINISEGTWGGHVIEFNDVFNTVKETGDHGAFNSWGRDRYWHPDKRTLDTLVERHFELTLLDAVKPVIIRNNRFRCDNGWDIDLDDGSGNYRIYNNLCLNGGLKLREGVRRSVENNILLNNTFHPHVWFNNSRDVFRHNIVSAAYKPIGIRNWTQDIDFNIFPDSSSLQSSQLYGVDLHSVYGDPMFEDPENGNYTVRNELLALKAGFKNFAMDSFGVVTPGLKQKAGKVVFPVLVNLDALTDTEIFDFMGAQLKNITTLGERSVSGIGDLAGIRVVDVKAGTKASKYFLPNDVILSMNYRKVENLRDFLEIRMGIIGSYAELTLFRNQKEMKMVLELEDKK